MANTFLEPSLLAASDEGTTEMRRPSASSRTGGSMAEISALFLLVSSKVGTAVLTMETPSKVALHLLGSCQHVKA